VAAVRREKAKGEKTWCPVFITRFLRIS